MQNVTLAVAILGCALVLVLPRAYALSAYVGVIVWYPDYMRFALGTLDISVSRIVICVLLLRCIVDSGIARQFVWSRYDKWVVLSIILWAGIYCAAHYDTAAAFENRGGFAMDTLFVYLAARLTITNKREILSFAMVSGVILAPLAVLGAVEAVTHRLLFYHLTQFRSWRASIIEGPVTGEGRWGLTRAMGPFSHPIMFGSYFATFLPLVRMVRYRAGLQRSMVYILCGLAVIGALSSMSSCSWLMLGTVVFCLAMERFPGCVKPLARVLVVFTILVEVVSNRHFYHVFGEAINVLGGDWWQRVALVDRAIADFGTWCWIGTGGRDPMWFDPRGADFTDLNNEFLMVGVESGLFGLLAFCVVLVLAFRGLARSYRRTADKTLKSVYWALGSILVGTIVVWQGVSYFGQPLMLFYCVLGLIGSSFTFAERKQPVLVRHARSGVAVPAG